MADKEKRVIGLVEEVFVIGNNGREEKLLARIDTGATKGSIDAEVAANLQLGPIIRTKLVKSAHGVKLRPVVEATFILAGRKITSSVTVADRSHMKFKVLIGQNTIREGFLIDPSRTGEKDDKA